MLLFISYITSLFFPRRSPPPTSTSGPQATSQTSPASSTPDQYIGTTRTKQQTEQPQQQEPPKKSFWGRLWGAVRSVAVVIAATVVTGALMATGVGIIGVAIAIGAGILAGTAVGAATNVATAIANGGTKEAWKEAWKNTIQDFKSSCIGAVSTACGFGVARLVTGTGQVAARATLGTKLFAGSAAGGAGATVSTVVGTADQLVQANAEFRELVDKTQREEGRILSQKEVAQMRQRFMEERKLTTSQILRGGAVSILTGIFSGGVGAKFQAARASTQTALSQGLNVSKGQVLRSSFLTEATTLTGVGMASSVAAHGELSLEEAVQHIGGSYVGGYIGNRVNRYVEHKAQNKTTPSAHQEPHCNSTPVSAPSKKLTEGLPKVKTEDCPVKTQLKEDVKTHLTRRRQIKAAREHGEPEKGIRQKDKLNESHVVSTLDEQLMPFTQKEVEVLLASCSSPIEIEAALHLLQKATKYGSMDGLHKLNRELFEVQQAKNLEFCVDPSQSTLGDNIAYFQGKGGLDKKVQINSGTPTSGKKPALILDEALLAKLEADPAVVRGLQGHDCALVCAEGWITGINPFNQGNGFTGMPKLITRVKELMASGMSRNKAVSQALNEPIIERLTKLGLQDKLHLIKEKTSRAPITVDSIVEQLAPRKMSATQLEDILKLKFSSERHREAARELLVRNSSVYSPRRLGLLARRQHRKILKAAEGRKIAEEDIYYLIPQPNKSYSTATNIYRVTNNIPANRIITNAAQIRPSSRKPLIVVLDDVGASGQSLRDYAYGDLRSGGYAGDIVIAPYLATKRCNQLFARLRDGGPATATSPANLPDKKLIYLPGERCPEFFDSKYYRSLTSDQQRIFKEVMGHLGFGLSGDGPGLCVAFPYMAPDNNNAFFSSLIAHFYTLNGKGVKNSNTFTSPPPLPAGVGR